MLSLTGVSQMSSSERHTIFMETEAFHSLKGRVLRANFTTDSVVVYLYREQTQGIVELVDSMFSFGKGGAYEFQQMVIGTYYLKARTYHHDEKFVDTYYGDDPAWITSKAIVLRNDMTGRNINLIIEGNAHGMANISGEVIHGATSPTALENDPAKNIPVLLMNEDYLMRRTYTDNNGKYNFDNVPISNYHVIVDFPGKSMLPYLINLNSANDSKFDVNFLIEKSSITAPGPDHNTDVDEKSISGIQVFPNPFDREIFVTNTNGFNQFNIIDLTGKTIVSKELIDNKAIDLEDLEKGVYYLILKGEKESEIHQIIKKN